jgi:hypothetical protein
MTNELSSKAASLLEQATFARLRSRFPNDSSLDATSALLAENLIDGSKIIVISDECKSVSQ